MTETSTHPEDEFVHSTPLLIIEDSVAIALRIEEFLTTLGYTNIQISNSGKDGIVQFERLLKTGRTPVVCLDYNLGDIDAGYVLPHLLEMKPNAKIIIISALDRTDKEIKDVIMKGAYFFIQKPVRLDALAETMKLIEHETMAKESKVTEINSAILSALGTSLVSLNKICEICSLKPDRALVYLRNLEVEGSVISQDNFKEMACNKCGSVLLEKIIKSSPTDSDYSCSRCNSFMKTSEVKWMETKAFRVKVEFKLNQRNSL